MKCEKCKQNEASVYYSAAVNGETHQQYLCAACAEELGLDRMFSRQSRDLMEEAFGGFFGRDPFRNFFGGSMLPGFGLRGMSPVLTMPRIEITLARPEATSAETEAKPDPELERRREINALRAKMDAAVKAEDFEKAIEWRNRLRELEK